MLHKQKPPRIVPTEHDLGVMSHWQNFLTALGVAMFRRHKARRLVPMQHDLGLESSGLNPSCNKIMLRRQKAWRLVPTQHDLARGSQAQCLVPMQHDLGLEAVRHSALRLRNMIWGSRQSGTMPCAYPT